MLADLFAAGGIADEAERQAAKAAAMKALGTVLRYRARIAREFAAAMRELDALRQRRLAQPQAARRSEPEPAPRPVVAAAAPAPAVPDEPERGLNRHQRRALAAMERQEQRRAA